MAAPIQIAILAHANRDCLEDLLGNIATYVPGADVTVFNGGHDENLATGLEVDVCPLSQPLRLGNLVPFHVGVMRWLSSRDARYEFLVLLDSDMLFMRGGLHQFLRDTMASSEFMATNFQVVEDLRPRDWDQVRRFCSTWRWRWQPLFGTERPAHAFNPGMIVRRDYAEKLLRFPRTERILATAARSRIYGIEELVFSTFALAVDANPIANPGSVGIRQAALSVDDVGACAANPAVYLLHKIPLEIDDPARLAVHELPRRPPRPSPAEAPSWAADRSMDRAPFRERLKDVYFRLFP